MDIYYEKAERILSRFPASWQKNYYKNKLNLIVEYKKGEIKSTAACYNHNKNIITIYDENVDASVHELFHMAFRDPNKVGLEIDDGIIYGNGVALEDENGEKKALYGLTEGFAEYLSRLDNTTSKGHILEYFFTDLLIFVYGEEILEYPFNNDPLGLIRDNRFYNLRRFTKELDKLYTCEEEISIASYMKKELEQIIKENKEAGREIMECIGNNMKLYNASIAELIGSIIEEYLVYSNRHKVDKNLFIKKLDSLFQDPDYKVAFVFDNKEHILKKKLHSFIELI